jgi:hypothetical protein
VLRHRRFQFFTRDKLDPIHHPMKQMEIEYPGIITQVRGIDPLGL